MFDRHGLTSDFCSKRGLVLLLAYDVAQKSRASPVAPPGERNGMDIRGSSLIESLVAMSIFSIGSAATGAWVVRSSFDDIRASRRLAATAIAASLEARMRSNREGAFGGKYVVSSNVANCAQACDGDARAADDMRWFVDVVGTALGPSAHGEVACTAKGQCVIVLGRHDGEVLSWPFAL